MCSMYIVVVISWRFPNLPTFVLEVYFIAEQYNVHVHYCSPCRHDFQRWDYVDFVGAMTPEQSQQSTIRPSLSFTETKCGVLHASGVPMRIACDPSVCFVRSDQSIRDSMQREMSTSPREEHAVTAFSCTARCNSIVVPLYRHIAASRRAQVRDRLQVQFSHGTCILAWRYNGEPSPCFVRRTGKVRPMTSLCFSRYHTSFDKTSSGGDNMTTDFSAKV